MTYLGGAAGSGGVSGAGCGGAGFGSAAAAFCASASCSCSQVIKACWNTGGRVERDHCSSTARCVSSSTIGTYLAGGAGACASAGPRGSDASTAAAIRFLIGSPQGGWHGASQ